MNCALVLLRCLASFAFAGWQAGAAVDITPTESVPRPRHWEKPPSEMEYAAGRMECQISLRKNRTGKWTANFSHGKTCVPSGKAAKADSGQDFPEEYGDFLRKN